MFIKEIFKENVLAILAILLMILGVFLYHESIVAIGIFVFILHFSLVMLPKWNSDLAGSR